MSAVPLIYLLAGEVSGDLLGGRLMAALSAQTQGRIAFAGVGGATMQAQGLHSLFPMEELSLMGLAASDAPGIVDYALKDLAHFGNPRTMSADDYAKVYETALK